MNMLRILNVVAMISHIFQSYFWIQAILSVYHTYSEPDLLIRIFMAFFLMNGIVWIVLMVNFIVLKEKKEE